MIFSQSMLSAERQVFGSSLPILQYAWVKAKTLCQIQFF